MNKKLKIILELAGFLLASLLVFCLLSLMSTPAGNRLKEEVQDQDKIVNYVALGDSLTEGVGDATGQGGFVPLLAKEVENQTTGNRIGAQVGVIFQDFNLYPQYSVKENIGLALKLVAKLPQKEVDEQVADLMMQLDLTAYQNQYPHALSGGQKQRVAIARALAMQPGVLAYDEPTSGLDEASTARVVEVIKKLQLQGVTQLIVTHDLAFADQLDATVFDFSTDVQR